MTHAFWLSVTHLGNSMLLLPAALVLALWLLADGERARALVWALGFGAAVLLVLASKLAFLGWGLGSATLDFTGISGHATMATSVITLALWLPFAHRGPRVQAAALATGLAIGVLVGISRLVLRAHSPSEVVAGCLLGALVAWLPVVWPRVAARRLRHRWVPVALAASLLMTPQLGRPAEAHGLVVRMAMQVSGRNAVFERSTLHLPQPRTP
ncbi:phosphatase PAP2 family protein [Pseudorhodoferax sp.]|uniref:phosphatase PAP2 family protein n=1 Tax=Pseudorhodoferax sp. TaxID=1993553 RepID=UPI002DD654BB|nr:phosphatase PAP2 family protein [Pseudorhodoferax sp.]